MTRGVVQLVPITKGSESAAREPEISRSAHAADRVESAYVHHHEWVFYLAMRYGGGDQAWAEDVTQDVFIQLLREFERGTEIHNPRGWLSRTTTNRCITKLRRARFLEAPGVRTLLGIRARQPATPEELGIVDQDLALVARVLRDASPKERASFYLHHIDHISLREIGETIGHTKGYVSKLIARVEARIQQARAKEGEHG